ncbi:hypothetical protein QR98_0066050 [Sarcoptes scabiei]|nr:hypothetical protein QR98_0066050 [Sarcoptes scabiei]
MHDQQQQHETNEIQKDGLQPPPSLPTTPTMNTIATQEKSKQFYLDDNRSDCSAYEYDLKADLKYSLQKLTQ